MEERKYRYTIGYENGSAARKLNTQASPQEVISPRPIEQQQPKQQRRTGIGADIFSMLLLAVTISMTFYMCITYLMVQSDLTQLDKAIDRLESEISSVSKENDAMEAVLDSEVADLEYIYQMAVGVLGMVYPNNNEVIYYDYQDTGYFRQYQDIPE
ncbi:MAG: hypothetical protein E7260_01990 [Lachnospiraceae bacterium]|nr:hypothetical protein [Lachnospiraceae bacterium]